MMKKNDSRTINAWASYDWANSVYNLIVTTAIFPVYYTATTEAAFGGEMVEFFGITIKNTVLYTYAISFSFLLIVLVSPILSGIADYTGRKKRFMQFFVYMGALSCMSLYLFEGSNIEYGISCAVLASFSFAGSLVFYNGFLPEVATQDRMDDVSAKGFAAGYVGSVILLVINLVIITYPTSFGFADVTAATKFGFILVGFWWLGFSQIAFYYLKDFPTGVAISSEIMGKGIHEIKKVYQAVRQEATTKWFLGAFFIFSMGVQTVILLAPLFANSQIEMGATEMIIVILIIQLVAVAGAYTFSFLSNKKGNGFAISAALVLWASICLVSYFVTSKTTFFGLAGILGFVMGGIQTISRSTYSKLIPKDSKDTASYFSFYDITEKLAIVIGTFSYGYIEQVTNNSRYSLMFMAVFFLLGLIMLQKAKLDEVVKDDPDLDTEEHLVE